MPSEAVVDWDSIIHKNVRSADGEPAGNITAIKGDKIFVQSAGSKVHAVIPKSMVEGFNGAEVTLKKPMSDLGDYVLSDEEPLLDWDSVIQKNVRSADGKDAGSVAAIKGDKVIIKSPDKGYKVISKSMVDSFNGTELVLKKRMSDLANYLVQYG